MAFRMMNDELVFDAKTVFRSEAKVGQIQPAAIQEVLISTLLHAGVQVKRLCMMQARLGRPSKSRGNQCPCAANERQGPPLRR